MSVINKESIIRDRLKPLVDKYGLEYIKAELEKISWEVKKMSVINKKSAIRETLKSLVDKYGWNQVENEFEKIYEEKYPTESRKWKIY